MSYFIDFYDDQFGRAIGFHNKNKIYGDVYHRISPGETEVVAWEIIKGCGLCVNYGTKPTEPMPKEEFERLWAEYELKELKRK